MTKEDLLAIAEKKISGKILHKDYTENKNVIFLDEYLLDAIQKL